MIEVCRTSRGKFSPSVESDRAYPAPASLCYWQRCSADSRQLSDVPATLDILPLSSTIFRRRHQRVPTDFSRAFFKSSYALVIEVIS